MDLQVRVLWLPLQLGGLLQQLRSPCLLQLHAITWSLLVQTPLTSTDTREHSFMALCPAISPGLHGTAPTQVFHGAGAPTTAFLTALLKKASTEPSRRT